MPMFESAAAKYSVPLPLLLTLGYYGSAFENRGSAPTIVGGSRFNENTPSVSNGIGLYNIGMLARIAGSVTYSNTQDPQTQYFVLDDGSGLDDGDGHAGIKVVCGTATPPSSGTA